MIKNLYLNFNKTKTVLSASMLLTYIAGIHLSGGNVIQLALLLFYCFVCILIPGYGINRKLNGDNLLHSLSFVYGFAQFCVVFIILTLLEINNFSRFSCFYIGVAVCIRNLYKPKLKRNKTPQLRFFILLYAFVMFIYTFLAVAKHAHPTQAGQLLLSQDFMWTVGNRESIKAAFPPTDIRFSGVTLKYHYFTELITAGLSSFSSVSCYNILGFYLQSFMMMFFFTALYELGNEYYKNQLKTNLFVLSFFALSCLSLWKVIPGGASVFNYSLLETIISNVNSQVTSLAFTAVFTTLVLKITGGKKDGATFFSALLTFGFIIFSKSPAAAILALAIICAAAVNLFTKNEKKITSALSLGVFLLFRVIYTVFLSSGTGKSTAFSLTGTLKLGYFRNFLNLFMNTNPALYKLSIPVFMAASFVCMMPFQTLAVVPQMLKDSLKILKLPFEKLWFYAAICGGSLAFFITWHEAFSQVYFIYIAIFYMNLLAVEYFDFTKFRPKYTLHYSLAFLSCVTTLCFYTNFGGSGLRQYLFHYDILEKYPYTYCVKAEDELAGGFLKKNMQDGELFITNRTHTGAGEGLSNVYTCFSGRQSYMEGFKYTVSNMGIDFETDVAPRLELVGKVFGIYDEPVAEKREILSICKQHNIRYALLSTQFEGSGKGLENFEKVYNNGTVTVYKIY